MKKIIYTSLFLLSLVFLGSRSAYASVIYSQTDSSGYSQGSTQQGSELVQGTDSYWYSITVRAASTYAGQTLSLGIHRCGSGSSAGGTPSCGYGSPTDYATNVAPVTPSSYALTSTPTDYTFTFNTPFYASSTKVWAITPARGTYGQDFKEYGSANSSSFPNGTCSGFSSLVVSACTGGTGINDLYFIVYDQNGATYPPSVTNTTLNPSAGTFNVVGTWTASTTACASQYLDVWQNTGLESHRQLSLHGVFPITTAPIYATTSGAFNFTFDIIDSSVSVGATSTTYSLTPNQQFNAQLYQSTCGYDPFTGTGVAPALLTSTTTVTVATSSTIVAGGINNNPFTGANFGNNSLPTSTDMLSFVNVPNLLATKVPFAYVFQISSVIYNAVNGSTSASAIPSGSFSVKFPVKFGISGVATATTTIKIDMFSTSTIGYFLTPSYVGLLRGLMVAVTYFLTAWYLFHEARNRKLL